MCSDVGIHPPLGNLNFFSPRRWVTLAALASLQDQDGRVRPGAVGAAWVESKQAEEAEGAGEGVSGGCAFHEEWDGKLWYDLVSCWSRGWGAPGARGSGGAQGMRGVGVAGKLGAAGGKLGGARCPRDDGVEEEEEDAGAGLAALGFRVGVAGCDADVARNWGPCSDGEGLCGGGDGEGLRGWRGVAGECLEVVEGGAAGLLRRGSPQGWHLQRFLSWIQLAPTHPRHTDAMAAFVSRTAVVAAGSSCNAGGGVVAGGDETDCNTGAGLAAAHGVGAKVESGSQVVGQASDASGGSCEQCEQLLALHVMLVLTRNLDSWVHLLARECCSHPLHPPGHARASCCFWAARLCLPF